LIPPAADSRLIFQAERGEDLRFRHFVFNLAACAALAAGAAHAQSAEPTASKLLEISAFGGLTGTYTGLSGGRNLGITAGVDVGFRSFFGWRPFLEGRGTYPIDDGHIDAQKSALGGIRLERERPLLPGLHVYGDVLFGRGEIDYQNGGYPALSGNYLYLASTTPVVSPGLGVEYRLTDHVSALADVQFQHWDTPATPSGSLWAKPITFGARYRFNFNRHGYAYAP
jgi:opacity protein-like surface antigen